MFTKKEMQMNLDHINDFNSIIRYLAQRDVPALTSEAILQRHGTAQVDLLVLMGGITTPDFAEMAANVYHGGLSKHFMIVGGDGHSTKNLRRNIASHYGSIHTAGRPEADILSDIMVNFLSIKRDDILIERNSTNCGTQCLVCLGSDHSSNSYPQ